MIEEKEDLEQEINLCILEIQKKETIQKNDFEKEFLKRMQIIYGLNNKDMNYLRRYRHLLNKIQELKSRSLSTKEILKELEISPEVYYYLLNLLDYFFHQYLIFFALNLLLIFLLCLLLQFQVLLLCFLVLGALNILMNFYQINFIL